MNTGKYIIAVELPGLHSEQKWPELEADSVCFLTY